MAVAWIEPVKFTGPLNAWTDIDVSAYVPNGASGVVLYAADRSFASAAFGFRKNGSTDNREQNISDFRHTWAIVGVDENQIFEAIAANASIEFWLMGYIEEAAKFFTNGILKNPGQSGTWVDMDISDDTGKDTAKGAILEIVGDMGPDGPSAWGVRKNGSTDNRIHATWYHGWGLIGVDDGGIFELRINTLGRTHVYLTGYTVSGIHYHTNAVNYTSLTKNAWTDLTPLPQGASGGIFEVIGSYLFYGLRKKGHSFGVLFDTSHSFAMVEADSNRIIEGFFEVGVSFFLVGFSLSLKPLQGRVKSSSGLDGAIQTLLALAGKSNAKSETKAALIVIAPPTELEGTVQAVADGALSLHVSRKLKSTIEPRAEPKARLKAKRELAVQAHGKSIGLGALWAHRSLEGMAAPSAKLSGSLESKAALFGESGARANLTGTLGATKTLLGQAFSFSGTSGILSFFGALQGILEGHLALEGVLARLAPLSGRMQNQGEIAASLSKVAAVDGKALGHANTFALLRLLRGLAGVSLKAASLAGELDNLSSLKGAALGLSDLDMALAILRILLGQSTSQSDVQGGLELSGIVELFGQTESQMVSTLLLSIACALGGRVDAASNSAGFLRSRKRLAGQSQGQAKDRGSLKAGKPLLAKAKAAADLAGNARKDAPLIAMAIVKSELLGELAKVGLLSLEGILHSQAAVFGLMRRHIPLGAVSEAGSALEGELLTHIPPIAVCRLEGEAIFQIELVGKHQRVMLVGSVGCHD